MTAAVDRSIGLRNQIIFFFVASQIINFICDATVCNFAIRRLDKTKFVNPREGRHRTDETDVRAFRCFDRTNAAVMRRMNVPHFEPRAITRKTAWSKSREPPLMCQFRERIRLIHELREL